MRKTLVLLVFISIVSSGQAEESIFRVGFIGRPLSLDPALIDTTVEFNIAIQMFEGLTAFTPGDLSPQPGIAERWNISEDGLTYTFHLRKNARWSDGTPITASTFKYSWLRTLNQETNAVYAYLLYYIKNAKAYHEGKVEADEVGITAKNPHTLEITLEAPTSFFLNLTMLPIYLPIPEHIYKKRGDQWATVNYIVVNGPFLVTEWFEEKYLLFEKNPNYWDRDKVGVDNIVINFFIDSQLVLERYRNGKLDWISGFISTETQDVINNPDTTRFPILATYYYSINVTRPALSDSGVRKALYLSINRSKICRNALTGGELPAFGFIPPRIPGYPHYLGEREDPEKARQLLREAGYPDGRGFPKLKILFNDYFEHELIAEEIRKMWKKEINIDIVLDKQDRKIFREKMLNLDYDIARSSWVGDYVEPSSFLDLFEYRTSGNNRTGWSHPAYTKLLHKAKEEKNLQRRFTLYSEAETILIDETPIIPIYHGVSIYMLKPYVKGIYPNPMDLHPLKKIKIMK